MTRLAFVSTMRGSAWGGSEFLWAAAAERALDAGHSVILSVSEITAANPAVARLRDRGAVVVAHSSNVKVWRRAVWKARRSTWLPRGMQKRYTTFDSLFATRLDAVCVSHSCVYDPLAFPDLARHLVRGVPFVTLNHLSFDSMPVLNRKHREAMSRVFHQARLNGFAGYQTLRMTERQLAEVVPNAIILQNPVNLSDASVVTWPSGTVPRFGVVGRLDAKHKGHDILFESLSKPHWLARKWECYLYGTGPDEGYLMDLARHYGIAERVVFAGHMHDIRSLWADTHLLVMPSRCEGTPLALIEAMLCGRPSVVTAVGDNARWISDGNSGFVAAAPTPELLSDAMERAWGSRNGWREMGAEAHRCAADAVDPSPGATLLKVLLDAAAGPIPSIRSLQNGRNDIDRLRRETMGYSSSSQAEPLRATASITSAALGS